MGESADPPPDSSFLMESLFDTCPDRMPHDSIKIDEHACPEHAVDLIFARDVPDPLAV